LPEALRTLGEAPIIAYATPSYLKRIEQVAEIYLHAKIFGKVKRIPPQAQQRLREVCTTLFGNL